LVWRIRKKISQIIKDYFYLPFLLYFMLPSFFEGTQIGANFYAAASCGNAAAAAVAAAVGWQLWGCRSFCPGPCLSGDETNQVMVE
jgi:hypothetical protein